MQDTHVQLGTLQHDMQLSLSLTLIATEHAPEGCCSQPELPPILAHLE